MKIEDIQHIIDGKKAEILELEREETRAIRQLKARRLALESSVKVFEDDLKRRRGLNG